MLLTPRNVALMGGAAAITPWNLYGTDLLWWHDLQDPTIRFSDFIGTPAVAGDRVQLLMDKAAWQGRTLAQELAQQVELRGNGTVALIGSAPAATYNTGTGAGTASRVDGSNQSYVNFASLPAGTFYLLTIQNTGAISIPVRVNSLVTLFYTVSSGATASIFIPATGGNIQIASGANAASVSFIVHSFKSIPGAHAYQTGISGLRPLLQLGGNGAYYLEPDGLDDFMATSPLDLSSTNKVAVFTAVRKVNDAAFGTITELSPAIGTNNGAVSLYGNIGSGYSWQSKGTSAGTANANSLGSAPISNVLTGLGDIAGDSAIIRSNGTLAAQSTANQGTGNYGNYPLYYFRRGGASLPFQGYFWGAFGVKGIPTAAQIAQSEALLNRYAQAY